MKSPRRFYLLALLLALAAPSLARATPQVVFSTDFDSGLPSQFSAPGCVLHPVQGYAGLGPAGRQFGGSFLRYYSVPLHPTTLIVRNLPPHDHLSVKFLLALIDSWDSTELMRVSVDGVLRFDHRFSLALADTTTYSPAPPGGILSMSVPLGFSWGSYYNRDRAYDLGVEPAFLDIPHTADTVAVTWSISAVAGPAADQWQGGDDESWAIDAVSVEVELQTTDVAQELASGRLALAGAIPNPARAGRVSIHFALAGHEPAALELLDLSGRRVTTRDLGGLGPGRHSIEMSGKRGLSPGIYFARLTQGASTRTRRVVVID